MTTIDECTICGAEIKQNTSKRKMYCSPECKKVRNNRVRRDKSKVLRGVRNCKSCGKKIESVGTSRRAYCDSKCKDSFYIKNSRDRWTRIQMRYRLTQDEWENMLKNRAACVLSARSTLIYGILTTTTTVVQVVIRELVESACVAFFATSVIRLWACSMMTVKG